MRDTGRRASALVVMGLLLGGCSASAGDPSRPEGSFTPGMACAEVGLSPWDWLTASSQPSALAAADAFLARVGWGPREGEFVVARDGDALTLTAAGLEVKVERRADGTFRAVSASRCTRP